MLAEPQELPEGCPLWNIAGDFELFGVTFPGSC